MPLCANGPDHRAVRLPRPGSVGAHAIVQNAVADSLLDLVRKNLAHGFGIDVFVLRQEAIDDLVSQQVEGLIAIIALGRCGDHVGDTTADALLGHVYERRIDRGNSRLPLFLAHSDAHLLQQGDDRLKRLVTKGQRFDHHIFGDLVSRRLDHDDGLARPGETQVKGAISHFGNGGVGHKLAVDIADANCADRPIPGYIGDGQRGAGGIDRHDVQMMNAVGRQGGNDHLYLVAHPIGEKRTQRAVGQT